MKPIKTIFATFLSIILLGYTVICFSACKNSFKSVYQVKFTTFDGKTTTLTSYCFILYEERPSLQKYYDSAPQKYQYGDIVDREKMSKTGSRAFSAEPLSAYKKKLASVAGGLTEDDIGQTIYAQYLIAPNFGGKRYLEYSEYKFEGWAYNYVHIKVINPQTIEIKRNVITPGEISNIYTVSSYSIIEFYD